MKNAEHTYNNIHMWLFS